MPVFEMHFEHWCSKLSPVFQHSGVIIPDCGERSHSYRSDVTGLAAAARRV